MEESNNIERVQKVALRICLKDDYHSYEEALTKTKLKTLEERRKMLCLRFAKSCAKHPQMKKSELRIEYLRSSNYLFHSPTSKGTGHETCLSEQSKASSKT